MSTIDTINRLTQKLELSRPDIDKYDLYFSGTQPLQYLASEVRDAVGSRLFNVVINWPRLVINSLEERLDVEGFRLGGAEQADDSLWSIWQANTLDEMSQLAHMDALVHARSYAIVWGDSNGDPLITVESARQVYVEHDPATRTRTLAIKRWIEDGRGHATLYAPDKIQKYVTAGHTPLNDDAYVPATDWNLQETINNPLGVVPVVPLINRRRILNMDGESELAEIVPLADAINKLATDMLVSSEFHSMPRRWVTGLEIMEDDAGNPVKPFSSTAGSIWQAESGETTFGQFGEAELRGFIEAIKSFKADLAALAGLPPHYVALNADQPASADAIRSAEASLVQKARRKMRPFGGAWEEVMRLAIAVQTGSVPSTMNRLETVWRDPETRTVAQAADAATKLVQAGIIPPQQAQEDLGYSPQARDRMRTYSRQSALDNVAGNLANLLPTTTTQESNGVPAGR